MRKSIKWLLLLAIVVITVTYILLLTIPLGTGQELELGEEVYNKGESLYKIKLNKNTGYTVYFSIYESDFNDFTIQIYTSQYRMSGLEYIKYNQDSAHFWLVTDEEGWYYIFFNGIEYQNGYSGNNLDHRILIVKGLDGSVHLPSEFVNRK